MALSKTVHPQDRTRFARLSLVIIEELTPLLQDVLHDKILPSEIFNRVSRQMSLFQKLRSEQIALIQNAKNDGYKEFDITLTYTLLRNLPCLRVTAPTQGWGTSEMPGNGETTLGDDIERIRLIRNKICGHPAVPSMPEPEFQTYWSNITEICKRMQTLLGKNYIQSLEMAKARALDAEMEHTYLEKIKKMCIAEKSTRELLQEAIQVRSVEEIVRVEARDPRNRKPAESLIDTSISILNFMVNSITEGTSESEIDRLYESVEEFILGNEEGMSTLTFCQFFDRFEGQIKRYANLRNNAIRISARYLHFILSLKKKYDAKLLSSRGSLLLNLTFSSERGYDLYQQDLKRGDIGKLILRILLYPPYLANFNLQPEDLMIFLNDSELTAEIGTKIIMDKLENFLKSAEGIANALGTSGSGQIDRGDGKIVSWSFKGQLMGFEWKYIGVCVDKSTGETTTAIKQSKGGAIEHSMRDLFQRLAARNAL